MKTSLKSILVLAVGISGMAGGLLACAKNVKSESVAPSGATDSLSLSDSLVAVDSLAELKPDSLRILEEDSIEASNADKDIRYKGLSEADFKLVADQLGVEVAAMKAVVLIEAGSEMKGFWAPGVPVVNYDASMWKIYGTKGSRKGNKNAKVPAGLSGYALKEWTQLTNARKINEDGANMSAFWGMFQIGGFNYKRCGCASVDEFVKKMSESELQQLELFAVFIRESGMLGDLKNKNWSSFARKYNGPSYAKRKYHTRMAAAYKKFKGGK